MLAAVFAPASDEFFFAARGQGATHNGKPVHATAGTALDFSRVAGPKPLVERLNLSPGEISLHPRIGSLALRLCRVAQGNLDAAFAGGNSRDWDLAAANLIVQEADGRMTALSGDAILYNRREVGARGAGGCGTRSSCEHRLAFSKPSAAVSAPLVLSIRACRAHSLKGIEPCQTVPRSNCFISSSAAS